jgi:hypothetical protein
MPDSEVKTIQDLIYYQYAKIITRRAIGVADGKEAKAQSYGLIKNKFRELKSGAISWSEITGPQITTFWGLRCATRGREKVHILRGGK